MRITWDELKRQSNLSKHGLDFADLTIDFFLETRVVPSRQGRFVAVGSFRGKLVIAVVYRPLGSEA